MTVFATYNIKGGVGKTTSTVNLSWLSASHGLPTLVCDLDPQGASSFYFRIKPKLKGGAERLLRGKLDLDELIKGTDYENLDLLPADFSYRAVDVALGDAKKPDRRLHKLLGRARSEYTHIFLDCAPGISLLAENAIRAADALLVPLIPTPLSLRTYAQLTKFLRKSSSRTPLLLPFFNLVDRRRKLHVDVVRTFLQTEPRVLQSYIPNSSDVERMGVARKPLGDLAPARPAMAAYRALWREIVERSSSEAELDAGRL